MSLLVHVVGVHVVVIVLVALIICAWSLTLNHCIFENLFLVPCALCPVPCSSCSLPFLLLVCSGTCGFWETTQDMLLSRTRGGLIHNHIANNLEKKTWQIQGTLLMRRGDDEEDDTEDAWIPETYLLEDVFTGSGFGFEHDDQILMEDEMKQVRKTFQDQAPFIKRIFDYYSAGEEDKKNKKAPPQKGGKGAKALPPTMDRSEFKTLIADIKIMKNHKKLKIKNKHIRTLFDKANADPKLELKKNAAQAKGGAVDAYDSEEDEGNPDDELNTSEFVNVLLRLSTLVYGTKYETLSEMFECFLQNDVRPNAMAVDKNIMVTALKDPATQGIFKRNRRMLKKIFDKYAAADASDDAVKQNTTINLEELKCMCRDANLFSSISDRMLRQIFMAAQQGDDEEEGEEGSKVEDASDDAEMDVSEFQEFLLAFGLILEPDPHAHYAKKTENFVELLVKRLRDTLHRRVN